MKLTARFTTTISLFALLLAVAAGPALGAAEAPAHVSDQEASPAESAAAMAALHDRLTALAGAQEAAPYEVDIPAERLAALAADQDDGGPLWIGVPGVVDFAYDGTLEHQTVGDTRFVDGTMVWNGTFRSEGARAVRLQLTDVVLPEGTELYAFGAHGHAYGPYVGDHSELWITTVAGEEVTLQLQASLDPGQTDRVDPARFSVEKLSHLGDRFAFGADPGAEKAFCPWNDSCIVNAECASIPSAVQLLQDAVAYLLYDLPGGTYLCTGGLLNDTASSGTPYLLTANHCFSTQSAATSLEAYFQWTVSCGASCGSQYFPPGSVPVVNGATLLATSSNTDFTFVELNGSAPSGSAFLGWTTSPVAFSSGTDLYRVSHPAGSPQAYSEQSVNTTAGTCTTLPRGNFIYSDATLADTEGGSSGSPVVNGSGQVVGQLFGACGASPSTTCDNDDRTVDGSFAVTYSSVEQWLDVGTGGGALQYATVSSDEVVRTVSLSGFSTPRIVAGPPSFAGNQACTTRLLNVGSSSFDHFIQEWDYLDGGHAIEDLGYLALEDGAQTLGTLDAEAGSVDMNHNWTSVSFSQSFSSAPVVVAQVASNNGTQAVTTRIRNVTSGGFEVQLEEEEGNDGTHAVERVDWIAIETGSTTFDGVELVVGVTGNTVDEVWETINFGQSVGRPTFVAAMQTTNGGDTASLRHRNLTSSSVEVQVQEEQSANSEVAHVNEVVGYFVLGTP